MLFLSEVVIIQSSFKKNRMRVTRLFLLCLAISISHPNSLTSSCWILSKGFEARTKTHYEPRLTNNEVWERSPANLSKDGVFVVKFICTTQSKEELAAIIMRPSVRHGNQSSSIKAQSWVEFILHIKKEQQLGNNFNWLMFIQWIACT